MSRFSCRTTNLHLRHQIIESTLMENAADISRSNSKTKLFILLYEQLSFLSNKYHTETGFNGKSRMHKPAGDTVTAFYLKHVYGNNDCTFLTEKTILSVTYSCLTRVNTCHVRKVHFFSCEVNCLPDGKMSFNFVLWRVCLRPLSLHH